LQHELEGIDVGKFQQAGQSETRNREANGNLSVSWYTTESRAAYWLPAAELPAFRMEVAAAKMRAGLWFGISSSLFS
jgi:hypothetical protein